MCNSGAQEEDKIEVQERKHNRGEFKRGVKTEKKSQVDTRDVCVCVVCVRAQ